MRGEQPDPGLTVVVPTSREQQSHRHPEPLARHERRGGVSHGVARRHGRRQGPGEWTRRTGRRVAEEVAAEALWEVAVRAVTYPVRLALRGLLNGFDIGP